jgi:hypothetical protein
MLTLTIASFVVAIVAVLIAVKQTKIATTQTNLARELALKQEDQEREIDEWQRKHETIAIQIARINPNDLIKDPNQNSHTAIYPFLFADPRLRQAIETYIVQLTDNRSRLIPRKPTPHELRSPALRETVTNAAILLDVSRKSYPTIAKYFAE